MPSYLQWDAREGYFWDSALAGSSSLQAAVARALKVENVCAGGAFVAHELWDSAKFYDSIKLAILCEELLKRNFPNHFIVSRFFVHAAPRLFGG